MRTLLLILPLILIFSCSDEPNQPPTLVILATPASGNAPLSVQCLAEASDPDSNLLTFEWDFGDGSAKSSEQSPTHTFIDAGSFTATCTVTDNGSPPKSTSKTVTITVSAPIPTLSEMKPAWKVTHMPEFTLIVSGTNFIPSSKIVFNGVEKTTEFVSASEISCKISPEETDVFPHKKTSSAISESSIKSETSISVWVHNPSPGGDSQPLNFTVRSNHSFSAPVLICSDASGSYKLMKGRYLYLIYAQGTNKNKKLVVSKDDGKTWLSAVEIPYSENDQDLSISTDSRGVLYFVNLTSQNGYADIMLTKSTNGGAIWSENRLLSAGTPDSATCSYSAQNPSIVTLNDDSLHIVWMEHGVECAGSSNYYIRSTDHGETWSERRKIPDAGTTNTYYPTLLGNGYGTLHYISYIGGSYEYATGPYYQYSSDKGLTWSSPVSIQPANAPSPQIPYPGPDDYLYLPHLFYIHYFVTVAAQVSKDHGQSWNYMNSFYQISGGALLGDISFVPDSAGNVHVFWAQMYYADWTVYYSRKINMVDLYEMWDPSPANAISPAGYKIYRDSCVVDEEGNLYMIWQSRAHPNRLYFVRSERD